MAEARSGRRIPLDILAAAALALVGALATNLPGGSTLRIVLVAPVLLLVPGYLLLQALVVPAAPWSRRGLHAAASIGISPAMCAVAGLLLSFFDGAFKAGPIIAVVTVLCFVLAGVGVFRRMSLQPHPATVAEPEPGSAA
jgi:uncharacterized membrane protein